MSRSTTCIVGILIILAFSVSSRAEPVASVENLKSTELLHGIVQLPLQGSKEAQRLGGCIFRFSDASFHAIPGEKEDGSERSAEELYQAIRTEKLGDLSYSPLNQGTFIAWSGRIGDVGEGHLFELTGQQLIEPPLVYSVEERSGATGKGYEGFFEHIGVGRRFIVRTTDGKYALIRLLEKSKKGAVIQWVLQPDGTRVFKIPESDLNKYAVRLPVPEKPVNDGSMPEGEEKANLKTMQELETEIKRHLRARSEITTRLKEICEKDATGTNEILLKAVAVETLGRIRAIEATDVLIREIDFTNPFAPTSELTIQALYPCVAALERIGKPASQAAIAGIRDSHLFDVGGDENRRLARVQLLTQVVFGVEGPDVARFILERELEKAEEASKPALTEALDHLNTKLDPSRE